MPTALELAAPAAEQRATGRERRRDVPRSAHAGWSPPAGRPDPLATIEAEDAGRVPDLVPIRHARMATSPFAFLRGSAAVMAADLATTPSSGIVVQSCGDCHLSNFGVFATPERRLIFDINDFDETLPAPFEWDVKRLAASFVVAARSLGATGEDALRPALRATASYRNLMRRNARTPMLDVWYQSIPVDAVLEAVLPSAGRRARRDTAKRLRKTRSRTNLGALERFAQRTEDGWRILPEPPLVVAYERTEDADEALRRLFDGYADTLPPDRRLLFSQYRLADFARKVVGVGSVGTEAFMFLFIGPQGDDPLFLQLKQAQASALAPYVEVPVPANEGRRVVEGQRLMQAASDVFLGWARGGPNRDQEFYVRQLRDMKGSAEIERMRPAELDVYAALCGAALARAHARSGQAAAIAGYLGKGDAFDRAIAAFAADYADQTERDHAALTDAIAEGRLDAREA
ncbi:MAG: DUF2252 domain-containing protein [Nocardioidaceae bacterium]